MSTVPFYGPKTTNNAVTFDKTYPCRHLMDYATSSTEADKKDNVFIGRYALVDYDHVQCNNSTASQDSKTFYGISYTIGTNKEDNSKEITYVYIYNHGSYYKKNNNFEGYDMTLKTIDGKLYFPIDFWLFIDLKAYPGQTKGYDSTIWQKVMSGSTKQYRMVAAWNGTAPNLDYKLISPEDIGLATVRKINDFNYEIPYSTGWYLDEPEIQQDSQGYLSGDKVYNTTDYNGDLVAKWIDKRTETETIYYKQSTDNTYVLEDNIEDLKDTKQLSLTLEPIHQAIGHINYRIYGETEDNSSVPASWPTISQNPKSLGEAVKNTPVYVEEYLIGNEEGSTKKRIQHVVDEHMEENTQGQTYVNNYLLTENKDQTLIDFYLNHENNGQKTVQSLINVHLNDIAENNISNVQSYINTYFANNHQPVQSDYNVNNNEAQNFIKNRPFYTQDDGTIVKLDSKYLDLIDTPKSGEQKPFSSKGAYNLETRLQNNIDTTNDKIIQGNYTENNVNSFAYIQNRPFYIDAEGNIHKIDLQFIPYDTEPIKDSQNLITSGGAALLRDEFAAAQQSDWNAEPTSPSAIRNKPNILKTLEAENDIDPVTSKVVFDAINTTKEEILTTLLGNEKVPENLDTLLEISEWIATGNDATSLIARVIALENKEFSVIYSGNETPSNDFGKNGDLFIQTE